MNLNKGALLQGGKYRIEGVLGQGGFGITYLAVQSGLNRKVAIKEFFMKDLCNRDADTSHVSVPSVGSKELVDRFKNKFIKEAQTIASLDNPHIIPIYDIFEENGTAYYVMKFFEGGSLLDLVSGRGRLIEADALTYIRQIADALQYIHERSMNHLDVKPGNVLLDEKGNAVLIDFGLAKRYDAEGNQTSTTPVGISHGYAPLEQYQQGGVSTFSPATDIYSLGATLYKLVTGNTPPNATVVGEDGLPAFPSDVSSSVVSTIERAMQFRRKDRPQSIGEFLTMLNVFLPVSSPVVIPEVDSQTQIDVVVGDKPTEFPTMHMPASSRTVAAVDLGLPSGTLWADRNVGADSPEDFGDYFAWGETRPKSTYDWKSYSWCKGSNDSQLKYCTNNVFGYNGAKDDKTVLELSDDAAKVNLGCNWRMPTKEQFQELKDKCTWAWITQKGVNGYKVTGPNGNSIFIPATGFRNKGNFDNVGTHGYYWVSSLQEEYPRNAYCFYLFLSNYNLSNSYRSNGLTVRAVVR